ncbi:MAG TPA: ATP-binding protein [Chloroflexota bacterium]|jgi:two-component system sensor histidine kinase MprB
MTLRARVTLAAGVAVLLAVMAVSATVYLVVRQSLHAQIDQSLSRLEHLTQPNFPHAPAELPRHVPLLQDAFLQVVDRDGRVLASFDQRPLPVTPDVLAVARGDRAETYFDAEADGTPVRVYVTSAGNGTALQAARSLVEVEQSLRQLMWTLIAISLAAVGLAVVLGGIVAAAAVAPVHRVAEAAEHVAETGELSHHIHVQSGDDLGRLAASFNTMLDALSASLTRQRQLVADASHELRTPLATVRTNVEVLARAAELSPDDRAALIRETVSQVEDLTRLVGDLVELARGDAREEPFTIIELDELTRRVVEAVRRHYPAFEFHVNSASSYIWGAPGRVERAVSNLVENAAKWSPPDCPIEITVRAGEVSVRDRGPGIDPADLPHVFDRFYRSAHARSMPGSGLGLAIVKQVADSHDGSVSVSAAPGGGALFALRFRAAVEPESVTDSHDLLKLASERS